MSKTDAEAGHLVLVSGMTKTFPSLNLMRWSTWMRAQSWSERTIADRVSLIVRVAARFDCQPESLDVDHVLAFLSGSTFSATSRKTYHASLDSWFRWLVAHKMRPDNPMGHLPKPKAGRRSARYITTAHLEHLLRSRIHARTRTMILLGAYQGFRVSEIAKVRGSDLDLISHEIRVLGKGDVEAVLPLHPLVAAEAAKYGQGWWFPQWTGNRECATGGHVLGASVGTIIGAAMKRTGIPGSAHSLRHWHATELLRSGVDSRVTQELMRHASLATTQLYMHVDDTQRRAGLLKLPDASQRVTACAILSATSSEAAA